jgi:hypothetical protein
MNIKEPRVDGYEATRLIKFDSALRGNPIIPTCAVLYQH